MHAQAGKIDKQTGTALLCKKYLSGPWANDWIEATNELQEAIDEIDEVNVDNLEMINENVNFMVEKMEQI